MSRWPNRRTLRTLVLFSTMLVIPPDACEFVTGAANGRNSPNRPGRSHVAAGRASAQEPDAAAVQPSASSPIVDAQTPIPDLDAYVRSAMEAWRVPGLSVAVVKDGRFLLSKGYGTKRAGTDDPVDRRTLFAIASNTKAFTAAAIAMLVEDGKVRWDDPVRRHLPWLEMYNPYVTAELRVRDLLCHRSGLGTFSGDLLWYGTSYSPREILDRAKHLKPEGPFRTHYGYSNLMFLAAGEVVASAGGKSWNAFVEERILKRLGMDRSATSVRDLVSRGNFATPHKTNANDSQPIEWVNWDSMAAAGGIVSSADDMGRWMMAQLRQGQIDDHQRLFSAESSHEMWSAQMPIRIGPRASQRFPTTHFRAYGLGWSLSDYRGSKLVGHGGGYDGMYSQVMLVPEMNLGIVVLTNSMTSLPDSIVYRAIDLFIGGEPRDWSAENLEVFSKSRAEFRERIDRAIQPVRADTKPSHDLADYGGRYGCDLYGDAVVSLEGEGLVLRLEPNPLLVADLTHLHYDTFVIRWRHAFSWFDEGTAHFTADARGVFRQLELDVPNDDLWFHELELKRRK
ncbi:MAG: serine hydrolase [Planctomycetes bacterium]|nr:serine hydrolase [Planctomycetota bacterium]